MKRTTLFALLTVAAVSCAIAWHGFASAPPAGIEPKGEGSSLTIAYVSLATAIVSLLTALVGLFKSVVEARRSKA
jgi:hypothetical protein